MPGAGARPGGLPARGGLLAAESEGTPRCWGRGPGRARGRPCRQVPQPQPLMSQPGGLGPRPPLRASSRPAAVKVGAGKGPGAEAASAPPSLAPRSLPNVPLPRRRALPGESKFPCLEAPPAAAGSPLCSSV